MPGPGGLLSMMEEQPQEAPPSWFSAGGPSIGWNSGVGPGGGSGGGMNIPPELAGYFDAVGNPRVDDPRKVASESGLSLGELAGGIFPSGGVGAIKYNVPNDKGGFFSIQDLFGTTARPTEAPGARNARGQLPVYMQQAVNVPSIGAFGQQGPSTNNWRLLGMGPGWIQRNGQLINTNDPAVRLGFWAGASPGSVSAEHGNYIPKIGLGTGAPYGMPGLFAPGYALPEMGWPGGARWAPLWGGDYMT